MQSIEENEKDIEVKGDQKSSNGGDDNYFSPIVPEPFSEETAIDGKSNELHFTMHIYKGFKLRIYKPLFLMKFALLFWFAGSIGIQAFFPVFLKQRGLTVAHMSLAIAASVVFQLIGASLSGVIADKIGRAKPILFAHMTITVIVSITFLLMPPLTSDATMLQFQLRSKNNDDFARLITEAWCNTSTILNEQKKCKLYYSTNNSNEEHCFSTNSVEKKVFSQTEFLDNITNIFENIKICYYESGEKMPSDASYTLCEFTYCKLLEKECISEIKECSIWNGNTILLFSVYALVITLHYMSFTVVFRFFDVTVVFLTAEYNADFGRQRVFAIVGSMIGPSLIGYVMQITSGSDKNYSLVFVFYSLFTILSALASWNVNIRVKDPGKRMWKKFLVLLKNPDILAFIIVLLVLGKSFNFMVIYSSWYLEDLGASKILLGLVTPLSSFFSLFSLYISKWWLRIVGEHNLFIMALVGFGFFGISYSFLVEPWYSVLIGAVVYTFSYHLLWVAVVEYAHSIAPEGLYATVIVMSGVLHYIVSRMTASLIGGMIMDAYGGRIAFRVMGSIDLVTAVLYGSFRYFRRSYR